MTRDELHIAFKIEMDKNAQSIAYGGCPAFLPEEVDYWLNKGYYDVLTTKFSGQNTTQTAFEGSVKRTADLERLVKTDTDIAVSLDEGTNRIVLSNLLNRQQNNQGRMFFIQAELYWTNEGNTKNSTVSLIDHETSKRFVESYNNKPWIDRPVAVIEDNSLIIYIDTTSMKGTYKLDITYVKHPTDIRNLPSDSGLTEVPEYVQNEIVNKAVQLALDNIESQRIQTKSQLNTLID